MPELAADAPIKRVQIEARVIRANGTVHELGVISDSKWKTRLDPRRLLASRRIRKANQWQLS